MKRIVLAALAVGLGCGLVHAADNRAEVDARMAATPKSHPRLLFSKADEADLKNRLAGDPVLAQTLKLVVADAETMLKASPVEHVVVGRRLLDKSRTCIKRVLTLAMAWRMTGEQRFLDRARKEMLAVVAFSDWNPSHYLDVAEMTTAMAIGYDWLYDALDADSKSAIRQAIIEKGLKTFKGNRGTNNWNQVCNGGMLLGALAVCEDEPKLAAEIVARAVTDVPIAMAQFAPDGAYPEGPTYWGYGTTYNVLLIAACESALGTDFGLCASPGFLASSEYYLQMTGPKDQFFNYSDSGAGAGIAPVQYWFAKRKKDMSLLWFEQQRLARRFAAKNKWGGDLDRFFPLLLVWSGASGNPPAPAALHWVGRGVTPVAVHRTGWDAEAVFVGIKAGSPSASHAHMDVGTFVMDADGVRWAEDLGMQDYHSLESKGVKLWGMQQESERWQVFRIGPMSHNILVVDGKRQLVKGKATITASTADHTVVDLGPVYDGQLAQAWRGIALRPDRSVLVQDEITAPAAAANVRWGMVTRAKVTLAGNGALLERDGKKLQLRVLAPADVTVKLYQTDPAPAATDARNEGTCMVGFELPVSAAAQQRLAVLLLPAGKPEEKVELKPLSAWQGK